MGLPAFRVLSLFSGVCGLDLGVRLAVPHARTCCYVENNAYCQSVIRARIDDGCLDDAPLWDDVTTFSGVPWRGKIDLVCGGFPCTDISNAGRRAGITGKQSGLWSHMARIIGEVRPRYVFIENVAALIIRGLDAVLGDLARLGYDAQWGVVSAAAVGAPHLRKRVFILAESQRLRGERRGAAGDLAGEGREVEGEARQRQRRGNAADDCRTGVLADTQRAERGPHALSRGGSGEGLDGEREAAGRTRERGIPLADAEEQRRELRPAAGGRPGRPAGGGIEPVEHAACLTEREPDDAPCAVAREGAREDTGGGLPLFPPGPADRDGWAALLAERPDLAPAVESGVRGVVARLPHRVDRLKALGNSVVPLQAAMAFEVLWARLQGEDG